MENKAWPVLKFCNHKRYRTSFDEPTDRLSQLPNDVLLSILSSFTMKEAARASVLSHKWNYLWRCFPAILNFEDESILKRIVLDGDYEVTKRERPGFIEWVNHVVEGHLGLAIDELKVTYDLDSSFQCHVDKWVVFAFSKQVKRLELNFTPVLPPFTVRCTLPLECCMTLHLPRISCSIKPSLTSLYLTCVNVTAEVIEYLLDSCPSLQNLHIRSSEYLTSLRASNSLQLKHLELINCCRMEIVDISAPKLLWFRHFGPAAELHIRDASLLLKVSVGGDVGDHAAHSLDSLSEHLPRLDYLALHMCLYSKVRQFRQFRQLNLGINNAPTLINLKHLELVVQAWCYQSLIGWSSLIEACPVLQKLTLKLDVHGSGRPLQMDRHTRRPIKCLETLEIIGFIGGPIDIEFATYVMKNAIMLKEVVVDVVRHFPRSRDRSSRQRLVLLERIIPQGVRLIIK